MRGPWRERGRRWRPTTRQTWGRLASGRTARTRLSPNSRPCRCHHRRARSTKMTESKERWEAKGVVIHLVGVLTGLRKNVMGCSTTARKELRKESTRASLPLAFEKIALSTMAITAAGRRSHAPPLLAGTRSLASPSGRHPPGATVIVDVRATPASNAYTSGAGVFVGGRWGIL